jgi:hypothetical protein
MCSRSLCIFSAARYRHRSPATRAPPPTAASARRSRDHANTESCPATPPTPPATIPAATAVARGPAAAIATSAWPHAPAARNGGPTSISTAVFAETPDLSRASLIAARRTDSDAFSSLAIPSNCFASESAASASRRCAFSPWRARPPCVAQTVTPCICPFSAPVPVFAVDGATSSRVASIEDGRFHRLIV